MQFVLLFVDFFIFLCYTIDLQVACCQCYFSAFLNTFSAAVADSLVLRGLNMGKCLFIVTVLICLLAGTEGYLMDYQHRADPAGCEADASYQVLRKMKAFIPGYSPSSTANRHPGLRRAASWKTEISQGAISRDVFYARPDYPAGVKGETCPAACI
jgi:hypothetical protein